MVDLRNYRDVIEWVVKGWILQAKKNRAKGQDDATADNRKKGAAGELAVSLEYGLYDPWLENVVQAYARTHEPDVGPWHVRSTSPGRKLLLREGDPNGTWILVWVMSDLGSAQLMGWTTSEKVMKPYFNVDYPADRDPCYMYPARLLHPMKDLPDVIDG